MIRSPYETGPRTPGVKPLHPLDTKPIHLDGNSHIPVKKILRVVALAGILTVGAAICGPSSDNSTPTPGIIFKDDIAYFTNDVMLQHIIYTPPNGMLILRTHPDRDTAPIPEAQFNDIVLPTTAQRVLGGKYPTQEKYTTSSGKKIDIGSLVVYDNNGKPVEGGEWFRLIANDTGQPFLINGREVFFPADMATLEGQPFKPFFNNFSKNI